MHRVIGASEFRAMYLKISNDRIEKRVWSLLLEIRKFDKRQPAEIAATVLQLDSSPFHESLHTH